MKQATIDHIRDTHIKGTRQQRINQGKWLNQSQVQQKFPHLMGVLNEMDTISS
jgi:hypothetical protein